MSWANEESYSVLRYSPLDSREGNADFNGLRWSLLVARLSAMDGQLLLGVTCLLTRMLLPLGTTLPDGHANFRYLLKL